MNLNQIGIGFLIFCLICGVILLSYYLTETKPPTEDYLLKYLKLQDDKKKEYLQSVYAEFTNNKCPAFASQFHDDWTNLIPLARQNPNNSTIVEAIILLACADITTTTNESNRVNFDGTYFVFPDEKVVQRINDEYGVKQMNEPPIGMKIKYDDAKRLLVKGFSSYLFDCDNWDIMLHGPPPAGIDLTKFKSPFCYFTTKCKLL